MFDANPDLPLASARYLAEQGLLVDAAGKVGTQTLEQWTGYSSFLYDQGLLADADGKPLAAPPDYASLFTNDFLPLTMRDRLPAVALVAAILVAWEAYVRVVGRRAGRAARRRRGSPPRCGTSAPTRPAMRSRRSSRRSSGSCSRSCSR